MINVVPYELELEVYQGPLEKLLELIEEKQLEITEVNLAKVTADFLLHIHALEEQAGEAGVPPELLSDFLVVASKLVLIKSKALLPTLPLTEEEEGEIRDFEARLRLYRELKSAEKLMIPLWHEFPTMAEREFLASSESLFYPPERLTEENLAGAMRRVLGELERFARPTARLAGAVVSLEEKIEEILHRIGGAPLTFGELRRGRKREELIVLFLAILHLIKTQLIKVRQEGHFDDIVVAKREDIP